jgi:hypothetical protein
MKKVLTDAEKAVAKKKRLAKKYGLTMRQLDLLLKITRCKICGREPLPGRDLYIDHDHKTGRVRGRLCFTCNYRLLGKGALGDATRHYAAYVYLTSGYDARNQ